MLPFLQSGQLVVIYYLITSEILPDERGHLFGEWPYTKGLTVVTELLKTGVFVIMWIQLDYLNITRREQNWRI